MLNFHGICRGAKLGPARSVFLYHVMPNCTKIGLTVTSVRIWVQLSPYANAYTFLYLMVCLATTLVCELQIWDIQWHPKYKCSITGAAPVSEGVWEGQRHMQRGGMAVHFFEYNNQVHHNHGQTSYFSPLFPHHCEHTLDA